MTSCPYCGHKKFEASAKPVRTNNKGETDAYLNVCKGCAKESVFCDRTGTQIKLEDWST